MFFEKFSIIKLECQKKLPESPLDCYSTNQALSHCAYLHQGMERTSSIFPILELEKLKHSKVLFKVLPPQLFWGKISKSQRS